MGEENNARLLELASAIEIDAALIRSLLNAIELFHLQRSGQMVVLASEVMEFGTIIARCAVSSRALDRLEAAALRGNIS